MADPRLSASRVGVGAVYATFKIDNSTITYSATASGGSAVVNRAVQVSAAGTVALAATAAAVAGKLIKVESDNIATVQTHGGMELPAGTGATLTLGKHIVGAQRTAVRGYVTEVNTAQAAQLGVSRGFITDASDTDAVEVYL